MRLSKNFRLEEFVDPETFQKYGDRCINFFDPQIFGLAQKIRDRYGSFVINNWLYKGERVWSGLRIPRSPYYTPSSQHSRGGAFDAWFGNEERNKEVRDDVIKVRDDLFPELGGLEVDCPHCHFDTRWRKNGELLIFSPPIKGVKK
tara:strand:- start:546 stop:983 length:438 start_codon:yes stop_codon:yes gene_type:complete